MFTMRKMFPLALVVAAKAAAMELLTSTAELSAAAFEEACMTDAMNDECSVSLRQLRVRQNPSGMQTDSVQMTASQEATGAKTNAPIELGAASTAYSHTTRRRGSQSTTLRTGDDDDGADKDDDGLGDNDDAEIKHEDDDDDDEEEDSDDDEYKGVHKTRTPKVGSTRRRTSRSPHDRDTIRSSCQCWWATRASCARDDGSACWDTCCRSPIWCDCSWTHGGKNCGVPDDSACYAKCCKGRHVARRRRRNGQHVHSTTSDPGEEEETDGPEVVSTTQVPNAHFARRRRRRHVQSATTVPEEDRHQSVSSTRAPDVASTTAQSHRNTTTTELQEHL